MAWLVALDGGLSGRRFALETTFLVGRGPYNHVVIDDPRVSRQHAKVSPEDGEHIVHDLGSANGTFVNDEPIKRHKLVQGEVVRFGPFRFRFELDGEISKSAPPPRQRVEERTRVGFEVPTRILNAVDAASAVSPIMPSGLVELEDADRKLRTLYAFLHAISTTLDHDELLTSILRNLLDVFPSAGAVAAYVLEGESGRMAPALVVQRDGRVGPPGAPLPESLHREIVQKGQALLSSPMSLSWDDEGPPSGGLVMHAPMMARGEVYGVLNVRGGSRSAFTQGELDLLTALAAHAALALQNARMHQRQLAQQRLEQDLQLAQQIQKSFLPSQLPEVPGVRFVAEYRPAYSVGGDFYDVFWVGPGRLGVILGDVSGKGVSAALLMARVSSDLRAAVLGEPDTANAMTRVNKSVLERQQHDIFVTAIAMTIDVAARRVTFTNAGHLPPFVARADGSVLRVEGGASTPIGLFEGAAYEYLDLWLGDGDVIVFCTDGVSEATSPAGEQFGFERFEESLRHAPRRTELMSAKLLADVHAHVGTAPQYDDLTLLLCGFGT
jgi:sigma-B regulation protein RsbU (phosphoserine phosphatase)